MSWYATYVPLYVKNMPAIMSEVDSEFELSKINRFPIRMRSIERRSDFFLPKFSVNEVNTKKAIIIAMKTRVEKKISNDLY